MDGLDPDNNDWYPDQIWKGFYIGVEHHTPEKRSNFVKWHICIIYNTSFLYGGYGHTVECVTCVIVCCCCFLFPSTNLVILLASHQITRHEQCWTFQNDESKQAYDPCEEKFVSILCVSSPALIHLHASSNPQNFVLCNLMKNCLYWDCSYLRKVFS